MVGFARRRESDAPAWPPNPRSRSPIRSSTSSRLIERRTRLAAGLASGATGRCVSADESLNDFTPAAAEQFHYDHRTTQATDV